MRDASMAAMDTMIGKYQNDASFHAMVDTVVMALTERLLTVADLQNAVNMGVYRYEHNRPAQPEEMTNEPQR